MAILKDINGEEFKISDVEMAFANHYLNNGFKAKEAYKATHPNIKDSSLTSAPYRYIKLPQIQKYIQCRRKEIFDSYCIDVDRVAAELSEIAFAIKGDKDYTTKDKLRALELLGKYLKMFEKQERSNETQTIQIRLED